MAGGWRNPVSDWLHRTCSRACILLEVSFCGHQLGPQKILQGRMTSSPYSSMCFLWSVYFGRKFVILCPTICFMAKSSKRKPKASGSFSLDSDICSPKGKKPCNSPRKVLDGDDQEKQWKMSDKITAQLETICQMLTSVESRLQKSGKYLWACLRLGEVDK